MKRRFLNKTYLVLGGMVGVMMLTGGILTLPGAKADDSVVSTATITVPVSCTMSGTGMNSHTASIENGRKVEGIGTTDIKAFCNDSEGFSIYAVGFTGDTIGNTYLRDTTLGQTDDILTSTTLSGNTSAWAMKLGVTSGTYTPIIAGSTADSEKQAGDIDYSDWAAVPASYQRVAYRNSATDLDNGSTAEGAQLTTTYAAYISPTQKAGTYVGKVKYTLVHPKNEVPLQPQPSTAGCINYFANASNAVGTMGCQSMANYITYISDGVTATLLASNFSRAGYGFAGWSDAFDYATNPNAHFYGPSEDITVPVGTTANGLSLYAVWIKSEGSLQDASKVVSVCNRLTAAPTDGTANLSSVSALTDQRDNETYAIAKLADGKCWMIENLRLESTNSDNASGALAQGYGGQFAGLADAEPAWESNITTANSLYSTDGAGDTISIGDSYASRRFPRYNNVNIPITSTDRPQDPTTNSTTNSTTDAGMYSYGNYYTWAAAIADTTNYSSDDHSATSICPTGWQIPLGGASTGDIEQGASDLTNKVPGFSYLDRKMGGTGAHQYTYEAPLRFNKYPINFVYSGSVSGGSVTNRGSSYFYWASTVDDATLAYGYSYLLGNIEPGTGRSEKYAGRSIRCVASGV